MDRKSPYFQRKRGKSQARRYDNQPAKPWRPRDEEPHHHKFRPHVPVEEPRRPSPFESPPSSPVVIIDRARIEPFDLFCALHLGITADGGYRPQSPTEVARRFGLSLVQLQGKAAEFHMDPDTVRRSGFDIGLARYDIKVAPEGISRRELAKPWYDEFLAAVAALRGAPEPPVKGAAAPASPPVVDLDLKNPIFED